MKQFSSVRRPAVLLLLALLLGLARTAAVPQDRDTVRQCLRTEPSAVYLAEDTRYLARQFLTTDEKIAGAPAPEGGERAMDQELSRAAKDLDLPPRNEPKPEEKSGEGNAVKPQTPAPASQEHRDTLRTDRDAYYIRVNRSQNTVTVYERDESGAYTVPVKAMVCSVGRATPLGTYRTSDRYVWRELFGYVYGQYATRITGHILFHSVPYTSMRKNTLKYAEYNKLGTSASMGCVRLSVADAKWIYDNCAPGTQVNFYDGDDPGPLGKPAAAVIDENDARRGWDPTDPDPENPWNK